MKPFRFTNEFQILPLILLILFQAEWNTVRHLTVMHSFDVTVTSYIYFEEDELKFISRCTLYYLNIELNIG